MISKGKPSYEELEQKIEAAEQAEKNSRLLLARLSGVMETARLGYWEHDIVRDVFILNDHFYRLFRTTAELEGGYTMPVPKYLQQFIHPDDVKFLSTEMRAAIESGNLHTDRPLEHRCIRRDGTIGHLAIHCLNSEIKGGRTVMVFGVIQDITERKEVEERLRAITDSARDAILMMDPRGDIQYWNPAAEQILGYSTDEALGKNLHRLLAPERFHPAYFEAFREFVGAGTGNAVGKTLELFAVNKDGLEIPVELSLSSVSLNGEWHAVGILRDITDRKKIEEQLLQGQKMKSIGTLAGGIAHDFNNILQPMLGYCEFLKSELPADSPHRGYVEGIFKAGLRAKELVKQILTFSRQSEQKKVPVPVQQMLKEAVKLARSTIPSNIHIEQGTQSDPVYIMADPTQLHQIIMNLIINAYHAVAQTGGRISVDLVSTHLRGADPERGPLKPGGYALLSVSDTGCGIEPAIMDKIFEPYFTTKSRGEGSGLGLAVVYGIVKAYGGDIKVRSEVGKGTAIHVYLPLTEKPSETESSKTEEDYPTGSERILFVDDEDMVVRIGSMMLERLGYQVTPCTSSRDALKTFKADPNAFDLVISDMTMPHMTGDQLSMELLALRPEVPIIICTGYSDRFGQTDAGAAGVRDFLMKPISILELSRKVRAVLDRVKGQHM